MQLKNPPWFAHGALKLLSLVLVISAVAWLFFAHFTTLECSVAHILFSTFAENHSLETPSNADLARPFILAVFTAVALIAAFKSSASAKWIILLQLIALSVVLHMILISAWQFNLSMLLSTVCACLLGIGFGSLEKQILEDRRKKEVQLHLIDTLQEELSKSRLELIKADEIERRVLAGDLHDQVLNDMKLLREKLAVLSKDQDNDQFQKLDGLIETSMQQIREVMESLSPAVLQHLGLMDAIEDCIRKGAQRASFKVRFRCHVAKEELVCLDPIEQTMLFRLVQEAVNNIAKHAKAKIVRCTITADDDTINIIISDDGEGMSLESQSQNSRGLSYMKQRAALIGASVAWRSAPGKGTTVEISVRKTNTDAR